MTARGWLRYLWQSSGFDMLEPYKIVWLIGLALILLDGVFR